MCNLYIMWGIFFVKKVHISGQTNGSLNFLNFRYYTESEREDYKTCTGIQDQYLVKALPPLSDEKTGNEYLNVEVPISFSENEIMSSKEKKGNNTST